MFYYFSLKYSFARWNCLVRHVRFVKQSWSMHLYSTKVPLKYWSSKCYLHDGFLFFSLGKVRATSFVWQTLPVEYALGRRHLILPDQIIFSKSFFFLSFFVVKHYSSALANTESTFHASKRKERYKINMYI